jgi:hypothetical protein
MGNALDFEVEQRFGTAQYFFVLHHAEKHLKPEHPL